MSNSKIIVLNLYKKLFAACKQVFDQDRKALNAAHQRIRSEFRKNKDLTAEKLIEEKIKVV